MRALIAIPQLLTSVTASASPLQCPFDPTKMKGMPILGCKSCCAELPRAGAWQAPDLYNLYAFGSCLQAWNWQSVSP